VSRRLDPFDPAVVSLGRLHGGQAENVIPERVEMSGTLRYTQARVQTQIHTEIERAFQLVRPLGGDYRLRFEIGTPPMQNDPSAVELIASVASDLLGREAVLPMENDLGAEDFGCFSERAPGAMYVLGTRLEGDERFGHNPHFDIDERALSFGAALYTEIVLRYLKRG